MRFAITSKGDSYESAIDMRFGRCSYFVVYDTVVRSIEFIPNPNRENIEGSGPASVKLLASKGVRKVISGEFGLKVKTMTDQLKIQLIILKDPKKKIRDIIELIKH